MEKDGMVLLQVNPDFACMMNKDNKFYGWLFYKHPDGQWVTKRKLEDWEMMQAEDQREDRVVINKHKGE